MLFAHYPDGDWLRSSPFLAAIARRPLELHLEPLSAAERIDLPSSYVSALTPINFVQLPVVAVLAWLLFDEGIGCHTVVGASIIFASTFYIVRREAKIARRTVTDRPIAEQCDTAHRCGLATDRHKSTGTDEYPEIRLFDYC